MHTNDILQFLPLVILLLVVVAVVLRHRGEAQFSYEPCDILTPNEAEFFGRLRAALPDHYVFPQVAMSAIIAPKGYARNRRAAFNRIAQKRVDFVICTDRLQLLVLVELDVRYVRQLASCSIAPLSNRSVRPPRDSILQLQPNVACGLAAR
ncbi:DUF2726 domain-containing protein [Paraburkholderia sp. CNPSo 3274]|uniref:DUF2726 domain-containing protein n=1 Tax=Paraburkholderia sp. CNPSo 3274 TaxID=2940932 RepID=UPI0035CCCD32